jgi:hypothetical protein|tara:strand:- start:19088 stop:19579 length:492 start_codon:yes stop_codon:yes gene_type:complete
MSEINFKTLKFRDFLNYEASFSPLDDENTRTMKKYQAMKKHGEKLRKDIREEGMSIKLQLQTGDLRIGTDFNDVQLFDIRVSNYPALISDVVMYDGEYLKDSFGTKKPCEVCNKSTLVTELRKCMCKTCKEVIDGMSEEMGNDIDEKLLKKMKEIAESKDIEI